MGVLIGSRALQHYGRLADREPADWDIIYNGPAKRIGNVELSSLEGTNKDIYYYSLQHSKLTVDTPVGKAIVAPLDVLKVLKLCCVNHLDKAKHQWDLNQLTEVILNSELQILANKREKEVLLRIEAQKSAFFNKYEIPRFIDHDLIHSYIATHPMYLRILTNAVDVSEDKFNTLTEEEKRDLVREECLVLSLERELIPNIKRMPMLVYKLYDNFLLINTSNTTAMRWLSRMSIPEKIKSHPKFVTAWTQKNIGYVLDGMDEYWKTKVEQLPISFWEECLK